MVSLLKSHELPNNLIRRIVLQGAIESVTILSMLITTRYSFPSPLASESGGRLPVNSPRRDRSLRRKSLRGIDHFRGRTGSNGTVAHWKELTFPPPISQSGFRPERFVLALDEELRQGLDSLPWRGSIFEMGRVKEKEGVARFTIPALISSEFCCTRFFWI